MIISGFDVTVEYGDAATVADSNTWVELTDIDELSLPSVSANTAERFVLKQPGKLAKKRVVSYSIGDGSLTLLQEDAQTATLYNSLAAKERGVRVTFNDTNAKLEFDAEIGQPSIANNKQDDNKVSVPLTVLSTPVYTAGTPAT